MTTPLRSSRKPTHHTHTHPHPTTPHHNLTPTSHARSYLPTQRQKRDVDKVRQLLSDVEEFYGLAARVRPVLERGPAYQVSRRYCPSFSRNAFQRSTLIRAYANFVAGGVSEGDATRGRGRRVF